MRIVIGQALNHPTHQRWAASWHFEPSEREFVHLQSLAIHFAPTPQEAMASLLEREPFHQQKAPGQSPIDELRKAVREIWQGAGFWESPAHNAFNRKVENLRGLLLNYQRDRTNLHAAAIHHSTGLGLHFEQVAALCSQYDSGLDVLRKALPDE